MLTKIENIYLPRRGLFFNRNFSEKPPEKDFSQKKNSKISNGWSNWGTQPVAGFEENSLGFFKKIRRHSLIIKQYLLMRFLQFPKIAKPFAKLSMTMLEKGGIRKRVTQKLIGSLTKSFSLGESVSDAVNNALPFSLKNQQILLDYAEEMLDSPEHREIACNQISKLLDTISNTPILYVPIKLTSIISYQILEKLSCGEVLTHAEKNLMSIELRRLDDLASKAEKLQKTLFIDQEYPHQKSATFKIAMDIMVKFNVNRPVIYITIQAADVDCYDLLRELSTNELIRFPAVKLVNGAYVDWARRHGYSEMVQPSKVSAFVAFVLIGRFCLRKNISLYMGTHNLILEKMVDDVFETLNGSKDKYLKGQLYGFTTKKNIETMYAIFGPTAACIDYSLRRIVEGAEASKLVIHAVLTKEEADRIIKKSGLMEIFSEKDIELINIATQFNAQETRVGLARTKLYSLFQTYLDEENSVKKESSQHHINPLAVKNVPSIDNQRRTTTMKFIAIINKEVELKKCLNALAHMTFGLGHRIENEPDIDIFFGTTAQVREFRIIVANLTNSKNNNIVFSDFPHTMVGMSTSELLKNVTETPESQVTYYASCVVTKDIDPRIAELTNTCDKLLGYKPYNGKNDNELLEYKEPCDDNTESTEKPMKISMLFNTSIPLKDRINDAVLACLKVGKQVPHSEQRLLNIKGKGEDPYGLTNISFHSLAVVTTGKPYVNMRKNLEKSKGLAFSVSDSVLVAFGSKTEVENIILPKSTRLFCDELKQTDLYSVSSSDSKNNQNLNASSTSSSTTTSSSSSSISTGISFFIPQNLPNSTETEKKMSLSKPDDPKANEVKLSSSSTTATFFSPETSSVDVPPTGNAVSSQKPINDQSLTNQ